MPELQLASAFDAAKDSMFVLDDAGRILFVNKACERMFGRSTAEVVGEHVKLLMRPHAAASLDEDVAAYFREAEARGALCFEACDGHCLNLELSFSTAVTAAGQQHLLVLHERSGAGQPLELQSDAMRAARASAMEELSATVVHALNQPLTALTLYLQTIERVYSRETSGAALPDQVTSILEKSIHEAERASNMLQHLRESLAAGDAAVVAESNGVAENGEAPNKTSEPLDNQREHGGDCAVSCAIARGGDVVVDSGQRERVTLRPASPARLSPPPAQEEQSRWVNG